MNCFMVVFLLVLSHSVQAASFPGKTWPKRRPGTWSEAKLQEARQFAGTIKTAAVMIIQDGAIVDEWGDTTKKYMCHSMRKSFLSALYGIAAEEGKVDLSKSLADLGIDDNEPSLTEGEKKATIRDLLMARSGIYHPALYETTSMQAVKPLRGSHAAGSFWVYNNWDFNALGTIYEQLTKEKISESFERRVAKPIGMEDFVVADGSYSTGSASRHAAYPFVMSARDLARFGVLFLNKGSWNGKRIVPEKWVAESTKGWSDAVTYGGDRYGYMWWVNQDHYSARGAGGHYLVVVPSLNLVVAHRVDTFQPNNVNDKQFFKLLDIILEAAGRKEPHSGLVSRTVGPCHSPAAACAERLYLGDKHLVFYRSHSPQFGTHTQVNRALIMVHGASRNGDAYFGTALASAVASGNLQQTVVLAPLFHATAGGCRDTTEPSEYGWTCEDWKIGGQAVNASPDTPASSFDAVDKMVSLLNDKSHFPNLKEIVIAGHSAGGQYVQRYAATTRTKSDLPIRYFVANPSSYLYLNSQRISRQGACDEKGNCKGRFGDYWDASNCTTYNTYKHGLESLKGYAEKTGAEKILTQFPASNVTYLVGALDVNQDPDLETTCNAQAQGPNRRERGLIYWNYVNQQFQAKHKIAIIGGCGHSATCMFASPATLPLLFPK